MMEDHAQAVRTLFTPSGLTPLDGAVTEGETPPYLLVAFRFSTPDAEAEPDKTDLSFNQTAVAVEITCHSVATTTTGARAIADRVRSALLNATPTVAGRSCFPVRHIDGQEPRRDESTQATIFDQIDVYRFTSVPG